MDEGSNKGDGYSIIYKVAKIEIDMPPDPENKQQIYKNQEVLRNNKNT